MRIKVLHAMVYCSSTTRRLKALLCILRISYIQASEEFNLRMGLVEAADLISYNDIVHIHDSDRDNILSLVTCKIACVAYVIPTIIFYDSLDRIYTCQKPGGFQTAGYIGPLEIYAADAAPGYTVPLPGHYNLGCIVTLPSVPWPRYSSTTRRVGVGCQNGRRVGGGQYSLAGCTTAVE